MSNGMTQSERKNKILLLLQDRCMTRSAILRHIGGSKEMMYSAILEMCREGLLEHGENATLGNHREAQTYTASSDKPRPKPEKENFHGMAPSVFQWRGSFGLRS